MASGDRKWLPPLLVALAAGASLVVYPKLPSLVDLNFDGVLPFAGSPPGRPVLREVALFGLPALTLLVWAAFRAAPTAGGQRLARRMFPRAPSAVTSPEQFDRFASSYDAIVLGVVLLLVGLHAAILSAALQHPQTAARLIAVAFGVSLLIMGNVMPRLRPNWVAGLRTNRTLQDPQLWRVAHRAFGTAFVASGILMVIVAVAAPRYGLVAGVVALLASCVVGFVASTPRN